MTDTGKLQYIHIEKLVLNVAGHSINTVQGTRPSPAIGQNLTAWLGTGRRQASCPKRV